jgi:hypothetical protein
MESMSEDDIGEIRDELRTYKDKYGIGGAY